MKIKSAFAPLSNSLWVGADEKCAVPVISKTFTAPSARRALLTITGVGYFECLINGKAVCDYRFIPVASDYEARDLSRFEYPLFDEMTHRIYCYEFDVTDLVCEGENLIEVALGGGFYKQDERVAEGEVSYSDYQKTVFALEIDGADGTRVSVCSDGSETWKRSEIVYSNLFTGEVHDLCGQSSPSRSVRVFAAPKTELSYAIGVPDRVIRKIVPKKISDKNGASLFDVGENVSGVVAVTTHAGAGERLTLRFAENVKDGELDFSSVGASYKCKSGRSQIMEDVFISDGKRRTFEPKFVWHTFRYFTLEGSFDSVCVHVIHADTPVAAEFSSSWEGANALFNMFVRTQLDNMHGSFPSDCPHRERLGYTGDGQIASKAAMLILDSREFYRKWIRDILDCQNKKNGHVQHTAPFMGGGGGPGGWGSAIVTVPDNYYKIFGEREMLEECYEPACRYIDYLLLRSEDGLVVREEDGGWCLGDWCAIPKTEIPAPFVNTCYLIKNLRILESWAQALGLENDAVKHAEVRTRVEKSLKKHYADEDGISFADGVQGADAFAVWCGIAGEKTAARLAKKYDAKGHLDTGFLATDVVFEVLFDYGYTDVALKLLESRELGSFLYMKDRGATTVWETWSGDNSHCHPMFSACARQLFTSLLGIKQAPGSVGFERVIFDPKIPKASGRVAGKLKTVRGEISVSIENTNGVINANITAADGITIVKK